MKKLPPGFWLLMLLLGLPLAILLGWLLRDLIRELVVVPIAYFLWSLGRVFESLPQTIIWGVLVFGALMVGLRLLAGTMVLPPPAPLPSDAGGRVSEWLRWLDLTRRGVYSRDGLARHLGDVGVAVLAHQQRCTQSEMRLRIREGDFDLPQPLNLYLRAALGRASLRQDSLWSQLLPFRFHRPQPEVVGDVEAMLDYLEAALDLDDLSLLPREDM
ncbi:MAG: hypothetical protein JW892_13310 [Anaerolineae bacterium]|nr:hypothetical protein [Anaerolineae bacterium]